MWIELVIVVSVIATSMLSGVFGMAGGMLLMALLVAVKPVAAAMIIHGVVQATSNGARALILRRHIAFGILPWYLAGAALALGVFAMLTLVPDAGWVLIIIGVFPFLARMLPKQHGLDVTRPATAVVCGGAVTAAQLFAGASGPLLDVFYLHARLDRYQVIANKALTQTIGHLLKLVYYGAIIGVARSGRRRRRRCRRRRHRTDRACARDPGRNPRHTARYAPARPYGRHPFPPYERLGHSDDRGRLHRAGRTRTRPITRKS